MRLQAIYTVEVIGHMHKNLVHACRDKDWAGDVDEKQRTTS